MRLFGHMAGFIYWSMLYPSVPTLSFARWKEIMTHYKYREAKEFKTFISPKPILGFEMYKDK
jgi:hypothetical protein